jgi:hypothetical protein
MLWIVSGVLFLIWLISVFMHKGGFVHMFLLAGVSIALIQSVADLVARRAGRINS